MLRIALLMAALAIPAHAAAQPAPSTICNLPVPAPPAPPDPGGSPVIVALLLCFDRQGGTSAIEPATYLHYIQLRASQPSRGIWTPFDDQAESVARDDFQRLWSTGFLDDLTVETVDYPFANGAGGVVVVYHLLERPRVKLVEYDGLESVARSDVMERLTEKGLAIRLDAFVDQNQLRRAATIVRELLVEKGYAYAEVNARIAPLAAGPLLAEVRFEILEGPKVAIRAVQFLGNTVFTDDALGKVLKASRPRGLLSLVTGGGTFNEPAFADDAQRLADFYRDNGFLQVRVGQPQLRVLDDSEDGRTRWVQLRVPLTEGARFSVGTIAMEGQTMFTADLLLPLFGQSEGDIYSQERLRKGLERAREIYGASGYFEFTAYPDLQPRTGSEPHLVDITIRIDEGKPYTVHRIEFTGNTQTHDEVIRRELAIVEGARLNTEALKHSVRRLNQLGYFKPLEESALEVDRVAGVDDEVDIRLTVEEENRNQLTFGAGASQYEGLFANFSYTTSNFLGRGESLTAMLQTGTRSRNYQLSFTEPFAFGRAITAGSSLFSRKIDYAVNSATTDYSEARSGMSLTSGVGWRQFTRVLFTYGYEIVDTAMTDELAGALGAGTASAAWLAEDGRYTESSVTPSIVYSTVDNPFTPRDGMRLSASYQYAGGLLGGNRHFARPEAQAIVYFPLTRRTAIGIRGGVGAIYNLGWAELPYYQRYFLGGEMQIRGMNIRTVGPLNENNVATGGNRYALFNAEYYVDIMPRVRALAFHDAGQAYAENQPWDFRQLRTSSGVELRVNVPMLNVPFRLIYAWNVYRDAFQPARTFKFAIGTTF